MFSQSMRDLATLDNPAWHRMGVTDVAMWWYRNRDRRPPDDLIDCNIYVFARRNGACLYVGRAAPWRSNLPSPAWSRVLYHVGGLSRFGQFMLCYWPLACRFDVYFGRSWEVFDHPDLPYDRGKHAFLGCPDASGEFAEQVLISALRPRFNVSGVSRRDIRPLPAWMVPDAGLRRADLWRMLEKLGA